MCVGVCGCARACIEEYFAMCVVRMHVCVCVVERISERTVQGLLQGYVLLGGALTLLGARPTPVCSAVCVREREVCVYGHHSRASTVSTIRRGSNTKQLRAVCR